MEEKTVFETLNSINVNGHTEEKNGLTYLSWAWAWAEVKKHFPLAQYKVYENNDGWCYFTDGRTGWVKTGVEINGLEHIEYLPIMDFKNKSIPADQITSFDVNKAIQRSLTKAVARHGLGLYIYAGEDLPEGDNTNAKTPKAPSTNGSSVPSVSEPTENQLKELASFGYNLHSVAVHYKKTDAEVNCVDVNNVLMKLRERAKKNG